MIMHMDEFMRKESVMRSDVNASLTILLCRKKSHDLTVGVYHNNKKKQLQPKCPSLFIYIARQRNCKEVESS